VSQNWITECKNVKLVFALQFWNETSGVNFSHFYKSYHMYAKCN